jgi:hypothetical protein
LFRLLPDSASLGIEGTEHQREQTLLQNHLRFFKIINAHYHGIRLYYHLYHLLSLTMATMAVVAKVTKKITPWMVI